MVNLQAEDLEIVAEPMENKVLILLTFLVLMVQMEFRIPEISTISHIQRISKFMIIFNRLSIPI